jgi:hypothetical protein
MFIIGCGGATGASCDLTRVVTIAYCQDYEGDYSSLMMTLSAQCTQAGGVFRNSLCSHTGSVGGCRSTGGQSIVITWFYPSTGAGGYTAATTMQQCATSNGTYVNP